MRPVRIIATALLHASVTLTVMLVPLLVAGAMIQPAQAAVANPSPDDVPPVTPDHQPPWLVLPGEQLTLTYRFEHWYDPLSPGVLYLRSDTQPGFTRLPLAQGDSLVARVPGSLVRGHQLLYYAMLRNPATGKTVTVPTGGAHNPQRVWVLDRPLAVPLGTHSFGQPRPPDAIVAHADPNQVGFRAPPPGQEGTPIGPWSFDVAPDGSVWLLDEVNHRLLAWRPGRPDRPARTVRLPDALFLDFAVARDGTIYAAAAPPPGPGPKTLILYALAPTGQIRWTEPTLMEEVEDHVRIGPDGTVYALSHLGGGWVPLATPTGQPLPLVEQRRRTSPQQPLAGGLRLAIASVSAHEQRFALINQAGQVVRAWQVTSRIDLEVALLATPALVGGDPVVVVDALQQTNADSLWEHRVLRLAPTGGASVRFTLDPRVVEGVDEPITVLRVGADGQLYQLRTSPTAGVSIARYSLGPTHAAPPTTTPAPVPPPATGPPIDQGGVTAPTVTLPPAQPATRPASRLARWWIIPGLVALGAGALAALGMWLWYRRRHPAASRGPGRSRIAH